MTGTANKTVVVTGRPFELFLTGKLPKRWMDRILAGRIGAKRR